ncbi:hypothetical protein OsI_33284 [Oryza sativa Indica Group]|uniref:Uncharacterized protein n=1 Tax=Oryza sativa subsp. indica TaxID=39946 RepID=B8BGH8_ORYSI|nr:hypothetical protein OsI_33284 [Oryza sativa Indica Group]
MVEAELLVHTALADYAKEEMGGFTGVIVFSGDVAPERDASLEEFLDSCCDQIGAMRCASNGDEQTEIKKRKEEAMEEEYLLGRLGRRSEERAARRARRPGQDGGAGGLAGGRLGGLPRPRGGRLLLVPRSRGTAARGRDAEVSPRSSVAAASAAGLVRWPGREDERRRGGEGRRRGFSVRFVPAKRSLGMKPIGTLMKLKERRHIWQVDDEGDKS